jgi:Ca2+/Na+ antiporter|tara:strand:+ start:559 stop:723 length:165 start_codon:yes stop_codon:yes gene_type:complete
MATAGGIITFICVYGFILMGALSFFFAPNIITLMFLCFAVYIFTRRRTNDKEKD